VSRSEPPDQPHPGSGPPADHDAHPDRREASRRAGGDRDVTVHPVTEDVADAIARARALMSRARDLEVSVRAVADSLRTVEEEAVLIVDGALRALGASAAVAARLVADDPSYLELFGAAHVPDDLLAEHQRIPLDRAMPLADAVRLGDGVFIESRASAVERYPAIEPLMERLDAHALCAVPVRNLGRITGALALVFHEARHFRAADRAQLRALGARYARALHHARLYFAEREAREAAESAGLRAAEAERIATASREEAEAQRGRADDANRSKSRLLAVVSHDLRSPLGAMLSYGDLIADGVAGPVTPTQRQYLSRMRASGEHLLGMLDELLAAARLEARDVTVAVTTFRLGTMCDEIGTVAEPLASGKGIEFRCAPSDEAAVLVMETDEGKLRQVLVNLVVNAIKFTARGSVALEAWPTLIGDECGVEMVVRDTGIGIAAEHLGRIFEPFWQVANASAVPQGTGLGLSIARQYASLLGGVLTVESEPGTGTTFRLRLPARFSEGGVR
jgi:signal transduction histidine kinase